MTQLHLLSKLNPNTRKLTFEVKKKESGKYKGHLSKGINSKCAFIPDATLLQLEIKRLVSPNFLSFPQPGQESRVPTTSVGSQQHLGEEERSPIWPDLPPVSEAACPCLACCFSASRKYE